MITGLLKNNLMELFTGSRDNIGGVPVLRSWIPLKNRETVLMMHEIAVNSINVTEPIRFGLTKFDHRKNKGSWFRERTCSCTRIGTNRTVGSRKGGTCTSRDRGRERDRDRHQGGPDGLGCSGHVLVGSCLHAAVMPTLRSALTARVDLFAAGVADANHAMVHFESGGR